MFIIWSTVAFLKRLTLMVLISKLAIGLFRVPKALTFKMRPGAQPFLWKWVLLAWEWKMISISKAEHLSSFWNRGPGELGNGLLIREKKLVNNNRSFIWDTQLKSRSTYFKLSGSKVLAHQTTAVTFTSDVYYYKTIFRTWKNVINPGLLGQRDCTYNSL